MGSDNKIDYYDPIKTAANKAVLQWRPEKVNRLLTFLQTLSLYLNSKNPNCHHCSTTFRVSGHRSTFLIIHDFMIFLIIILNLMAMIKDQVISAFKEEFPFLDNKVEIMDLLSNNGKMDNDRIRFLKLPSDSNNIIWHPGVYVFIGNNSVYRVGVSMTNSRARVMQHLEACTKANDYCIWDIDPFPDRSILLFNVKNTNDYHWLKALEVYLEKKFNPLIPSMRT